MSMPLPQTNSASTNTDWLTPLPIIEALGRFDLDPCCPPVMPWETADTMICLPDDGLSHTWADYGRVWLNPPFRGAYPWVKRLREHGNGIALLPCATDTDIFFDNVWGHASGVLFIKRRVVFYHPDGSKPKNNINRPCCLVAYGANNLAALMASGLAGSLNMEVKR